MSWCLVVPHKKAAESCRAWLWSLPSRLGVTFPDYVSSLCEIQTKHPVAALPCRMLHAGAHHLPRPQPLWALGGASGFSRTLSCGRERDRKMAHLGRSVLQLLIKNGLDTPFSFPDVFSSSKASQIPPVNPGGCELSTSVIGLPLETLTEGGDVLSCAPPETGSYSVDQVGFKLLIFLFLTLECRGYRHKSRALAWLSTYMLSNIETTTYETCSVQSFDGAGTV